MNRMELVGKLSTCAPALARTNYMPILNCFWFDGKSVTAYNDQIGIVLPLATSFKGAVQGELLLGLLRNSRAKDVELLDGDGFLQIKGASSKFKLGLQPPGDFIWKCPASKSGVSLGNKVGSFLATLACVMESVSTDTTVPDQMGVTFIPEANGVGMYATNNATMSYGHFNVKWPKRVILPAAFCQRLVALATPRDDVTIDVQADHVIATIKDAGKDKAAAFLFSHVIESERPHDFAKTFAREYPEKVRKQSVPIHPRMKLAIERASLVSMDNKEEKPTQIKIKDGFMSMLTDGVGEVRDRLKLEGHGDVELDVAVRFLRSAFSAYYSPLEEDNGRIVLTPSALILARDSNVFLLAKWV